MKPAFKFVATLVLLFLLVVSGNPGGIITSQAASPYTEYYLVYTDNFDDGDGAILFITSPKGAYGKIEIPGLSWTQNFSVYPNQITKILLPFSAEVQGSDKIARRGIHIQANNQVQAYLLNPGDPVWTNDAYTALPVESLGTEYMVMAWPNTLPARGFSYDVGPSELAVLAPYNDTVVTIIPSITTGIRAAGVSYTVNLDQFDVYTLQDDALDEDLTGTAIKSTKPVAVFSGNRCVDIPRGYGYCDHIVEQMLPLNAWGKSYITTPMAAKYRGDFLRILSATDGTSVDINGAVTVWPMTAVETALENGDAGFEKENVDPTGAGAAWPGLENGPAGDRSAETGSTFDPPAAVEAISQQLDRGQVLTLLATGPVEITSSEPVLVAQYGTGQQFDTQGDPLMMLVPPAAQFLSHYTFLVPTGWPKNYVNIIIPVDATATVKLDSTTLDQGQFTSIGTQGYAAARILVSQGSHTIDAGKPFAIYVYGYGDYVSYGYPGGLGTSTINPPVGTDPIPVIVIPGIGGTKLENDQGELWVGIEKLCDDTNSHFPNPPESGHLDVLALKNNGLEPLYPDDPHYASVKAGGILETAEGHCTVKWGSVTLYDKDVSVVLYKTLIDSLERAGYQRGKNLFVFGYDWRRDINETAAQLDALVDQVRNNGQVNIIAHSMGGLVSRNYILDTTRAAKVDNLAILGTPFLGSPEALEALLFGNDLEINKRVRKMTHLPVTVISVEKIRYLAQNWPGAYELVPSERYLLVNPNGLIQEQNVDKNGDNQIKNGALDYAQTLQFLNLNFNDDLISIAEGFRSNNLEGFDTLGTNNVNVIIFAGAGQDTKEGIRYFKRTIWGELKTEEHAEWYTGNGDETVPLHSADLQGNGKNYQGAAEVYYVNDSHFGLVTNSDVFNQIMQVFGTGDLSTINANISTNSNQWTVTGKKIKIYSPADLHIYDEFGNHLGPTEEGGIEYGIPGAQYDIVGHDKSAYVPEGISYYAILYGTDSGAFDLVIENISTGRTVNSILFKDVPVTASTMAGILLSPEDGYTLYVDQDGDGTAESSIPPSAIVTGSASTDAVSPASNITIGAADQNGDRAVTISAADNTNGSGILQIQYSIDGGNTFSIYKGSFKVGSGKVKQIISKAIDKAGNEEYPLKVMRVPSFADVSSSHPYYNDVEILVANGLTSGCQVSPPKYCPDKIMNRAEAAAFNLRAHFGPSYVPPAATHIFVDDWTKGPWGEPWAEGMKLNGYSAGCQVNPPMYCPWEQIPREQAVIFALKIKYGKDYTPPPATGTLFADMTNTSFYATAWAEQAYREGLIPNCGMSGGKPKICPKTLVSRGLAAYMIVRAKDLSLP